MGPYVGKYRAIVMDNKDPEQRGRVLVKCPALMQNYDLGWAESCLPPGVFFVPKKDATVYIEFEQGSLDRPIWVGVLSTNKSVKENFFPDRSYDPEVSMIVSQKNRIVLSDADSFVEIYGELLKIGDAESPVARVGDSVEASGTDPQGGTVKVSGTIKSGSTKIKG